MLKTLQMLKKLILAAGVLRSFGDNLIDRKGSVFIYASQFLDEARKISTAQKRILTLRCMPLQNLVADPTL